MVKIIKFILVTFIKIKLDNFDRIYILYFTLMDRQR